MRSEEVFQESVRSMRNQTLRAGRAGDYWTDDEKNQLRILFDSGVGITEIALELGRTEPAVYQQIEKMDLYGRKQNPQRQRNGKKPPECLCGRCGNDPALCPLRKQCTAKKEN